MTPQEILFIVAVVFFALAALSAIAATVIFFVFNIPDVRADLTGRKRAEAVANIMSARSGRDRRKGVARVEPTSGTLADNASGQLASAAVTPAEQPTGATGPQVASQQQATSQQSATPQQQAAQQVQSSSKSQWQHAESAPAKDSEDVTSDSSSTTVLHDDDSQTTIIGDDDSVTDVLIQDGEREQAQSESVIPDGVVPGGVVQEASERSAQVQPSQEASERSVQVQSSQEAVASPLPFEITTRIILRDTAEIIRVKG